MSDIAITTLVTMVRSLPDNIQNRVVEQVREYIATLQDEERWATQFESSQDRLIAAARKAKREIAAGQAIDFDHNRQCAKI